MAFHCAATVPQCYYPQALHTLNADNEIRLVFLKSGRLSVCKETQRGDLPVCGFPQLGSENLYFPIPGSQLTTEAVTRCPQQLSGQQLFPSLFRRYAFAVLDLLLGFQA